MVDFTCHQRYDHRQSARDDGGCVQGTQGGECIQLGAARDSQTAADTSRLSGTVATGAATFSFIQVSELSKRRWRLLISQPSPVQIVKQAQPMTRRHPHCRRLPSDNLRYWLVGCQRPATNIEPIFVAIDNVRFSEPGLEGGSRQPQASKKITP